MLKTKSSGVEACGRAGAPGSPRTPRTSPPWRSEGVRERGMGEGGINGLAERWVYDAQVFALPLVA